MTQPDIPTFADNRPIIVGGVHRSGTSLIRRILNAHSRIHCGPELNFWRDIYRDSLPDPLRSTISTVLERWVPIQVADDRFITAAREVVPESDLVEILGGALLTLHERCASYANKPRWADKDPANVLYLSGWQHLLGNEWLFLHVVRNPLDTIASIKEIRFPWLIPPTLQGRIDFYRRYTEAGIAFSTAHPNRSYRVIYEQLVADPETVLRDMMEWLGERFEPEQLAFNSVSHQLGLEDPKVARTKKIHDRSVGRWEHVLNTREANQVVKECSSLWRQIDPACRFAQLP